MSGKSHGQESKRGKDGLKAVGDLQEGGLAAKGTKKEKCHLDKNFNQVTPKGTERLIREKCPKSQRTGIPFLLVGAM